MNDRSPRSTRVPLSTPVPVAPRVPVGPTRRGFLLAAGGFGAALGLAACSGHSVSASGRPAADTGAAPQRGGTLNLAFWADLEGAFDPNQVYWIETRSLNRNFADSLTDQDPETGEIVPWLAESWTVNDDASETGVRQPIREVHISQAPVGHERGRALAEIHG